MKTCKICKVDKPFSEFYSHKGASDGLYIYCKPCNSARNKVWREENRDTRLAQKRAHYAANRERLLSGLRTKSYNISEEEYQTRLVEQEGVCAICQNECSSGRLLAVDHDHNCCPTNGKSCGKCIRGLLCNRCNMGVGYFRDSPELLEAAIRYVSMGVGAKHG